MVAKRPKMPVREEMLTSRVRMLVFSVRVVMLKRGCSWKAKARVTEEAVGTSPRESLEGAGAAPAVLLSELMSTSP
jgi:hypothetical protein